MTDAVIIRDGAPLPVVMVGGYSGGGSGGGSAGESAYQIAVDNGFVGSQSDWLASLVGPPGSGGGAASFLFSAAGSQTVGASTKIILTSGWSVAGIGSAFYVYDAAVSAAYVTANPRVSFRTSDGYGFRLGTEQRWTIEVFGGKGDLVTNNAIPPTVVGTPTDNLAAFDAYWNYARYALAGSGQAVPKLHFGAAGYYFSGTLQPYSMVHLVGVGSSSGAIAGTVFCFPAETVGMAINGPGTSITGNITFGSKGNGASGSTVEGIYFVSAGGTDATKHGFWARYPFKMMDCVVDSFPGCGAAVVASNNGDATTLGNACESYMARVEFRGNKGKAALWVEGSDANDCTFDSIRVKDTYGVGILDRSGLGNTYVGARINGSGEVRAAGSTITNLGRVSYGGNGYLLVKSTDTGTTPGTNEQVWASQGAVTAGTYWPAWVNTTAYVSGSGILIEGSSNSSVLAGMPYVESLTVNTSASAATGSAGNSVPVRGSTLLRAGIFGSNIGLMSSASFGAYWATNGSSYEPTFGVGHSARVGGDANTPGGIFRHAARLETFGGSYSRETDGNYHYTRGTASTGSPHFFAITGELTAWTFARSAAVPRVFMPFALALGDPNASDLNQANARIVGMASNAPSSGDHAQGEVLLTPTPTAGGPLGYRCIVSGTSGGTWETLPGRGPLIQAVTSAGTVTPDFGNDLVKITAQAAALTLANPSGTAISGIGIAIRIKDNGTARAITYGTQYRAVGVTLPTTTVASKTLYLGCIWNSDDSKFDVVSVVQEA